MKHTMIVTPSGEEMVLLSKADFERIEDMLDVAAYDRAKIADTRYGIEPLTQDELKAFLAAPTPLAFWREKRGLTQAVLAKDAGTTQPQIADLEAGRRGGSLAVMARIAKALAIPVDNLADVD